MSLQHHLKVVTKGHFGQAVIELNGQEIQNGARSLTLDLEAGEPNHARIELFAPSIEFDGDVQVHLPEETQALLKRLGWTPPEEAT